MAEVTTRQCDRCKKLEAQSYKATIQNGEAVVKEITQDYCRHCADLLVKRMTNFVDSYKGAAEEQTP